MDLEKVAFTIISNSGDAKSFAMEAVKLAEKGEIEEARQKLASAEDKLNQAHNSQTNLIQKEAQGEKVELNLLLVHAQDHLMNTLTVKDMAEHFINLYERFKNLDS